ncbi:MAG: CDP-alcohol phosphatidyltransferase family protein [Methylococcaceae bacterium]|nr:CDP-alcohol phosphatidyltransferase family protein [Methylococcaceae bacterium]
MKARHIPNIITICRILLVYPTIALMLAHRFDWALALFCVAGLSDGLDGFLAKHYHWQSRLGSYLDPLADKLLLVSSFLALTWMGVLPVWLTLAVVLRDVVIVSGAVAYYFLLHPFEGSPHWTSKVNTFMQLLLIVVVLFQQGVMPLPQGLSFLLCLGVFLTSLASGMIYVYVWGKSYWRETHPAP